MQNNGKLRRFRLKFDEQRYLGDAPTGFGCLITLKQVHIGFDLIEVFAEGDFSHPPGEPVCCRGDYDHGATKYPPHGGFLQRRIQINLGGDTQQAAADNGDRIDEQCDLFLQVQPDTQLIVVSPHHAQQRGAHIRERGEAAQFEGGENNCREVGQNQYAEANPNVWMWVQGEQYPEKDRKNERKAHVNPCYSAQFGHGRLRGVAHQVTYSEARGFAGGEMALVQAFPCFLNVHDLCVYAFGEFGFDAV